MSLSVCACVGAMLAWFAGKYSYFSYRYSFIEIKFSCICFLIETYRSYVCLFMYENMIFFYSELKVYLLDKIFFREKNRERLSSLKQWYIKISLWIKIFQDIRGKKKPYKQTCIYRINIFFLGIWSFIQHLHIFVIDVWEFTYFF